MKKALKIFGYCISAEICKVRGPGRGRMRGSWPLKDAKLILGPGPDWNKPDDKWFAVDVDPALGDIVVDFNKFNDLPFADDSVKCVYGSHVYEHISIFKSQLVFNEIYRVLKKGGFLRLVLPDVKKSIKEYLVGNKDYPLFRRRGDRAKKLYGIDYTLFECLKEDFISRSGQPRSLGEQALAHQNAWDYDSIRADLEKAGFKAGNIRQMAFRETQCDEFGFEGEFPSEANEDYRSIYVEALK